MPTTDPSETCVASADIRPCRFVKSSAADFGVTEADANEAIYGVSDQGTKAFDSSLAAAAGNQLKVFLPGAECLLELGSGGVTKGAGVYLKSDADGKGIAAATTGATSQFIGAIPLESGAEGDLIRVRVVCLPEVYPALA